MANPNCATEHAVRRWSKIFEDSKDTSKEADALFEQKRLEYPSTRYMVKLSSARYGDHTKHLYTYTVRVYDKEARQ
jgi:hypothetical protein